MTAGVLPFSLNVSQDTLDWINQRVATARIIPDLKHPKGKEWQDGTPASTMEELVDYWRAEYDWRAVEKHINSTFDMFTVDLEEAGEVITLHFVHQRSTEEDAIPLLFAHGWPGSFLEVEALLTLSKRSKPTQQAFHIIAPSTPGFVFSTSPSKPGFSIRNIANLYQKLMQKLGYAHYVTQGGDWGSVIVRAMALQYPDSCVGVHINVPFAAPPSPLKHPLTVLWLLLRWFSPEQKKKFDHMMEWHTTEGGYQKIQSTKPQTVSYGLLDSPIGMLAWIREKLESLVPPDFVWPKDVSITWTMLYLLSNSAGHARMYKENIPRLDKELLSPSIPRQVAVGISCFPYDTFYVPEWWGRATIADNIVMWKEHSAGGHFPSVECPEVLRADILEFVEKIQGANWERLIRAGRAAQ